MPRTLRSQLVAGLSFVVALLGASPGGTEVPSASMQRDIETVNRMLRQRQLQQGAGRSPSTESGGTDPAPRAPAASTPDAARPAPPAETAGPPDAGAIRNAVERLADERPEVRQEAVAALKSAGAPAVPALIDALEDPEHLVRVGAVKALGGIRDPRAAEPLTELLGEDSEEIWDALWVAFGALGREAAPALIEALGSNTQEVRWRAVALMGRIRDPRFTEPLIDILNKDRSTGVRLKIAWALGRIRDRRACEALLDALHDW